ncbi:ABC transporter permease [Planosporangium sp. 12N6]|uniref:ABC transporter permease n=1 Tax=Planosporangium spinosum TaxID=3402278 RepID=UPI003CFBB108
MSPRITLHTTARILRQLRHDPRTIALLLVVPTLLLTLMRYVFDSQPAIFDRIGVIMLGVFPFIAMFLVTSVAMLRERTTGTLERLLTTPVHKLDLLFGYGLAFALAAAVQAAVAAGLAYALLGLHTAGSAWTVAGLAIGNAVLGMAIGLLVSAFAQSEFQAVQFMPAFILPQMLLCGLVWPRGEMAGWLEKISNVMPMTYAVDALVEVGHHADPTTTMWRDVAVVVGCIVVALLLGAATLRRRTT